MLKTGTIYGINGPVIYLKGNTGFRMSEMVYVGSQKLVGEVIALDKDLTTVQVYEETTGLRPGEEVIASGSAVSVTLAPGILNNIFDGIERSAGAHCRICGRFHHPGSQRGLPGQTEKMVCTSYRAEGTVSPRRRYHSRSAGDPRHHAQCMVPPGVEGTVTDVVPDGRLHHRRDTRHVGASRRK